MAMMMQYPGTAITNRYPSRSLCGKRYDNGAPFASTADGGLHTCFEDTVLVPLASWIFYLVLAGVVVVLFRAGRGAVVAPLHKLVYRRQSPDGALLAETGSDGRSGGKPLLAHRWPKTTSGLAILYMLLVVATLLMNILEIVRLYLADRGAGLLPFTLVSLVFALLLLLVPTPAAHHAHVSATLLVFWIFSLIFTSVKLATLARLADPEPRAETEYLNADQQLDVGVIIGLYGLSILVEGMRFANLLRARQQVSTHVDAAAAQDHKQS